MMMKKLVQHILLPAISPRKKSVCGKILQEKERAAGDEIKTCWGKNLGLCMIN